MSVFKVVTKYSGENSRYHTEKKYHDKDAIDAVISYVIRDDKTNKDLISGFNVNPYMAADEFKIIARVHNKDFGVHLRHMIISFSQDEAISPLEAKNIAYQVAAYYADEYQILFAVHIDARQLNVHLVMNTVSYRTGAKYDGKKQDYYDFIMHMKRILRRYGLVLHVKTDHPE